jgi:hypothetical protein
MTFDQLTSGQMTVSWMDGGAGTKTTNTLNRAQLSFAGLTFGWLWRRQVFTERFAFDVDNVDKVGDDFVKVVVLDQLRAFRVGLVVGDQAAFPVNSSLK